MRNKTLTQLFRFAAVVLSLSALAACGGDDDHSNGNTNTNANYNGHVVEPFDCLSNGLVHTVAQDGSGDFQTVQECVDMVAPGEVCQVGAGIYPERVNVSGLRGTQSECIVIRGESGAILDGEGTRQSLFYSYDGGEWFVIEGFDIRGSVGDGSIFLTNAHHVIIRDNVIHDTLSTAEGFFCAGGCVSMMIQGNEIFNITGKEGIYFARPDVDSPASHDILIEDNHLHDIAFEGVDLKNTYAVSIRRNLFERCANVAEFGMGVSLTTATFGIEIADNRFEDMGMGAGRSERGAAILTGDSDPPAHHVHIHHNLIVGGDFAGIFLRGGPDHLVESNTIVNVGLQGIDAACFEDGCGGAVIVNNLVANTGGVELGVGNGSDGQPTQCDYNLAFDERGGAVFHGHDTAEAACTDTGFECHSVVAQPTFVDAAAGDFSLRSGSAGCGQGEGGADMGAFDCGP